MIATTTGAVMIATTEGEWLSGHLVPWIEVLISCSSKRDDRDDDRKDDDRKDDDRKDDRDDDRRRDGDDDRDEDRRD